MKFLLSQDETVNLDLNSVVSNLNRIFDGAVIFNIIKRRFKIAGSVVINPTTYEKLPENIKAKVHGVDRVLLVTKKRYDNNHFWDSPKEGEIIFSCHGWEDLTTLPITNGLVYVICALIAGKIGLISNRHDEITGCISDFLWDKRGIDVCMRSAFVCADCVKAFQKRKLSLQIRKTNEKLLKLLNDLSSASRSNHDIVGFWEFKNAPTAFDVFLCHNSDDKGQIRSVSENLKAEGIHPWLDEEQIQPGRAWSDILEANIASVKTAAVFVGSNGFGPWQNAEMRAFLVEFVNRQCPVIPVILPGTAKVPDLPIFLRQLMWVDFRKSYPNPFNQLVWGITGRRIT